MAQTIQIVWRTITGEEIGETYASLPDDGDATAVRIPGNAEQVVLRSVPQE